MLSVWILCAVHVLTVRYSQRGNPLGGLVYSNAFPSNGGNNNSYQQVMEWHKWVYSIARFNSFVLIFCPTSASWAVELSASRLATPLERMLPITASTFTIVLVARTMLPTPLRMVSSWLARVTIRISRVSTHPTVRLSHTLSPRSHSAPLAPCPTSLASQPPPTV